MKIISFINPQDLPKNVTCRPFQGDTQEKAEAAFHKIAPLYDPGMAYWHTPTKTLMVPWDWKRETPGSLDDATRHGEGG